MALLKLALQILVYSVVVCPIIEVVSQKSQAHGLKGRLFENVAQEGNSFIILEG